LRRSEFPSAAIGGSSMRGGKLMFLRLQNSASSAFALP
jgi:hypothetical protein